MFADIASGESDWADVFFLIAVVLAALSALFGTWPPSQPGAVRILGPLPALALGFVALGLLVL